jgi:uncharacterized protein YdeI (YjbR/CyaY-like superfamily)
MTAHDIDVTHLIFSEVLILGGYCTASVRVLIMRKDDTQLGVVRYRPVLGRAPIGWGFLCEYLSRPLLRGRLRACAFTFEHGWAMPVFFETKAKFSAWLKANAATGRKLSIGFRSRPNGHACMSLSEAIVEASRYGWRDGRRIAIDKSTFAVVFAPDKAAKPGIAAGNKRTKTPRGVIDGDCEKSAALNQVSPESHQPARVPDELSPMMVAELKRHTFAWTQFQRMAPSQRQKWTDWVMSAKQEKTRSDRFARFLMDFSRPRE